MIHPFIVCCPSPVVLKVFKRGLFTTLGLFCMSVNARKLPHNIQLKNKSKPTFIQLLQGASVVVYKNEEIRKHQLFSYTGWPGGLFGSTTMAGTRSGKTFY